jgi:hypothetical protein
VSQKIRAPRNNVCIHFIIQNRGLVLYNSRWGSLITSIWCLIQNVVGGGEGKLCLAGHASDFDSADPQRRIQALQCLLLLLAIFCGGGSCPTSLTSYFNKIIQTRTAAAPQ